MIKNFLQTIPLHKFIIYVLTKLCKLLKQYGLRHFLKSYIMSMQDKVKNEQILPLCFVNNNNGKIILQTIPSHNFVIDMYNTCCQTLELFL